MTNTGDVTATNVIVDDPVPTDTTYVAGSAAPALASGPSPLVWNLGALGPAQSTTVRFTVRVNAVVSETAIVNVGYVRSNEIPRFPSNVIVHPFFPTAVELIDFSVQPDGDGLRISWKTGSELDTFGFAIYRSNSADGANKVLVTTELVSAKGANSSYSVLDASANKANRYHYWLQEVERTGRLVEYTPVAWVPLTAQQPAVAVGVVAAGGVPIIAQISQPSAQQNALVVAAGASANTQNTAQVLAERVVIQLSQPAEASPASANTEALQPVVIAEAQAPAQSAQQNHEAAVAAKAQASAAATQAQLAAPEANPAATVQSQAVVQPSQAELPSYQSKTTTPNTYAAPNAPASAFGWMWGALAALVGFAVVSLGAMAYFVMRRRNF
ncbi:MAG: DUF11 domain-containing protein [Anaerolineae bacterium]|nr:DUF11 domain-containing protein [Anaerolineae bacterium]